MSIAQQHGLDYLTRCQLASGGFSSQSSTHPTNWQPKFTYHTTFVPSLILAALSVQNSAPSRTIRNCLADFIIEQRGPHWSFNYWAHNAPERKSHPYPDDLDDTFCALLGLYLHNPELITADCLAATVKLLVATEARVGGPYRTWLVKPEGNAAWQDVDAAVNANIAAFLNKVSNPLPNIERLLYEQAAIPNPQSVYYPSSYPLWYYFARATQQQQTREQLLNTIVQQHTATPVTVLDCALLLSTLAQLGYHGRLIEELRNKILNHQQPNGSWSPAAFCIDPARNKTTYYHGSSALTTAFCIEALERAKAINPQPTITTRPVQRDLVDEHIVDAFKNEVEQLPVELRSAIFTVYKQLTHGSSTRDIARLPHIFAQSLPLKDSPKKPVQFYVNLGLANTYGWIAYTIFDNFLDDEGQPAQLPAATTALRRSLLHFRKALPRHQAFQHRVEQTFDTIDGANAWELANCRFAVDQTHITIGKLPNFKQRHQLADRSLGHELTPIAVLATRDRDLTGKLCVAASEAFRQYLIVRQLNDDAHDWQQDLQKGHITYILGLLLRDSQLAAGSYRLSQIMPQLEQQFWQHTLVKLCRTMNRHLARGRYALRNQPRNSIHDLLDGQQSIVNETLRSQRDSMNFLESYRGKPSKS